MISQSAYRLRRHFDAQGFRLAWDAAFDYAIRRLSDAVMSRAIHPRRAVTFLTFRPPFAIAPAYAILRAPHSGDSAMGLLDGLLGQVAGNVDIQNLAAKVGLSPDQVEQAVTALGAAHPQPGDTVATAADQTGLPQEALQQIVEHIGGEGALGKFAALLGEQQGGIGGMLGSLFGSDKA